MDIMTCCYFIHAPVSWVSPPPPCPRKPAPFAFCGRKSGSAHAAPAWGGVPPGPSKTSPPRHAGRFICGFAESDGHIFM